MSNLHPVFEQNFKAIFGLRDPADEHVGHLAPIEQRLVAEAAQREPARVIRIHAPTRYERDCAEIEAERQDFLQKRTAELLENRVTFGELLDEVMGGATANMAAVALRDAVKEQGQCWDGISAFGDLMHAAARKQAASEWPRKLADLAPECSDCSHSIFEHDPLGTGDSPSGHACTLLPECPWGKDRS